MAQAEAPEEGSGRNRINEELFKIGDGAKGVTYSQVARALKNPKHPDHYRLTTSAKRALEKINRQEARRYVKINRRAIPDGHGGTVLVPEWQSVSTTSAGESVQAHISEWGSSEAAREIVRQSYEERAQQASQHSQAMDQLARILRNQAKGGQA